MNEYHEKFQELQDKSTFKGQQWFGERKDLVEKYSWAIPNEDALLYLAEFDELVEVGAGSGYWANEIDKAGGMTMPYDIDPPDTKDMGGDAWTHVERANVFDMDEDFFTMPILLVWPALNEGVATEVAERGPPHILYVGEPRGGCTGEDEFFDLLDKRYGLVAKIDIPSYTGIHDDLFHYVRKL
jgi:hypothetical protein